MSVLFYGRDQVKFKVLLKGFYYLMKFTAWKDPEFREKLKEKDFSMVIGTEDKSIARHYICKDGNLTTGKGLLEKGDFSLLWKDASTGCSYMASGNPKAFAKAVGNGSLQLKGDAASVTLFLGLLNSMLKAYRGKKK